MSFGPFPQPSSPSGGPRDVPDPSSTDNTRTLLSPTPQLPTPGLSLDSWRDRRGGHRSDSFYSLNLVEVPDKDETGGSQVGGSPGPESLRADTVCVCLCP